jgi:hypothetical protein
MHRRAAAPELELRRAAISGDRNRRVFVLGEAARSVCRNAKTTRRDRPVHPINWIDHCDDVTGRLDMKSFELSLFADYFQFYIQDEAATSDLSRKWNNEAIARMLAIAPGKIGIGTARNMDVPVTLEIRDQEPSNDVQAWDYVVEATLDVASGRIVVAGCSDYFPDAMRITVPPGSYRVRVSYGSLDTLSDNGLDGDDHYRAQLWPAPSADFCILKHRPGRTR